jgi:2-keto-4-pentenoate hydratase/2-oxohepta-3-ene-1,7-dioic acid hydratase in catechol pathway
VLDIFCVHVLPLPGDTLNKKEHTMRLVTFRDAQGIRLGAVREERIVDLPRAAGVVTKPQPESPDVALFDMLVLIAAGPTALQRVASLAQTAPAEVSFPLEAVELLAPIPRPTQNIFCVGRNYAEHAAESFRASGREVQLPTAPNIFTKAVTTVSAPYGDIPFDARISEQVDWEVELAVIVGRGGRFIPAASALQHVFGYTVLNDVTARNVQNRPGMQWFLGKSLDGYCPMGPWIVTADEVADPQQLRLQLAVNGAVKQEDTTAHMLFDVAAIIEEISRYITLQPGDIIATGTPAGVGFARTPPEFLRPGDVMESTIDGIGTMRNHVVDVAGS